MFIYDDKSSAYEKEISILNEELKNPLCINIAPGGEGGALFKGKKHSEESKKKISAASKIRRFKKTSDQIKKEKENRLLKNNGKFFNELTIKKFKQIRKDIKITDETKNKISKSLKLFYKNNKKIGHKNVYYERTAKIKAKQSNSMKGKYQNLIWIKNKLTNESFRIEKLKFEEYQIKGFERGRILRNQLKK